MNNIEAGYLVKITTWENDADNYNTIDISGLTKDQARLIVEIVSLFESDGRGSEYGNAEIEDSEGLFEEIDKIISSFSGTGGVLPAGLDDPDPEWVKENYLNRYDYLIYNLIGTWNNGEYYRVLDSIEVFYVPEPINNVTEVFITNGN